MVDLYLLGQQKGEREKSALKETTLIHMASIRPGGGSIKEVGTSETGPGTSLPTKT